LSFQEKENKMNNDEFTVNLIRAQTSATFLLNQAKGLMQPRVNSEKNEAKAREHLASAIEILSGVK
jgi:hypothetical protein